MSFENQAVRPGDWSCPNCQFHNFASRSHCFKCSTPNPDPSAPQRSVPSDGGRPGDWACLNPQCNFHNFASRSQCMRCGTLKGARIGGYGGGGVGGGGYGGGFEGGGGGEAGGGGGCGYGGYGGGARPGDWTCLQCHFMNFASRNQCFRCGTQSGAGGGYGGGGYGGGGGGYAAGFGAEGGGYGGGGYPGGPYGGGTYGGGGFGGGGYGGGVHGGGGASTFRAGDWYCPSCSSHNFASRNQCLGCGIARPTTFTNTIAAADPPPPGVSQPEPHPPGSPHHGGAKPGVWVCANASCGYHNFAKRSSCVRCGVPPPQGVSKDLAF